MIDETSIIEVNVKPWSAPGLCSITAQPDSLSEIASALRGHAVEVRGESPNQRSGVVDVLIAVVGNPGSWAALAASIATLAHRHRGKKVSLRVGDETIEMQDYSAKDIERIASVLSSRHADADRKWAELTGSSPAPNDP